MKLAIIQQRAALALNRLFRTQKGGQMAGPRYQHVIDELTHLIQTGVLSPGEKLPRSRELAERFNVPLGSVAAAIRELKAAGLVDTRRGVGIVVRVRPEVRRKAMTRYQADRDQARATGGIPPATSFTRDHRLTWDQYRVDCDITEVEADATLAELLAVPTGTPLLQRRLVFYAHGQPQQLSYSHFLLDIVAATPVADPANEPWPGGSIAQLMSLGVEVTAVEESVRARMPTADETSILQIPTGVPVLTVTRRMLSGQRPVEAAADIVIPADRVALDYRIDL
jgi:GntR family transcriptional regulator